MPGEPQPSDRKVLCYTVTKFDPPMVTEVPAELDVRDKLEINGAATIGHETKPWLWLQTPPRGDYRC